MTGACCLACDNGDTTNDVTTGCEDCCGATVATGTCPADATCDDGTIAVGACCVACEDGNSTNDASTGCEDCCGATVATGTCPADASCTDGTTAVGACCVVCRDDTTSNAEATCPNYDAVSAAGVTMLTFAEWGTDTHGLSYASVGNLPATAGAAISGNDVDLVAGGSITFTWYQPTEATDYASSLRRYSKDEKVMTYSASGAETGSLTWVDGTAAVTLASASALIASAVALGAIALF